VSSGVSSPFGKAMHMQQQQQQQLVSSGASDAGLSAISSSTVPGSNSAVAGTPANSIIVSEYLGSGSVRGLGFSGSGKTPAPVSPGVSNTSLPAEQRAAFFASLDGRSGGARLSSSISRERLAEESVLQWLPASSSLPVAVHTAAAAASGGGGVGASRLSSAAGNGRGAAAGSAAGGGSSAGASRLVQRALGSGTGDKHRYVCVCRCGESWSRCKLSAQCSMYSCGRAAV
jgi:hypothetical protein